MYFQGDGMTWSDRQWALCVFDDLVEFCGPASVRYQPLFLQPLLAYTEDGSAEVRQAAVYGCGVMGQFGGPAYSAACTEALAKLIKVINAPESRSVDNINATENAISAVTKILKYSPANINKDEVIPHW
jgi:importin-5